MSNPPKVEYSSKRYSRYYTYVKPIFQNNLVKLYGTYTLTFFAIAFFIFFAIKPTVETIIVLQKKLETSQETLEQITQKSENLSLARQNLDSMDPTTRTKIETAVPTQVDLKSLIVDLERSANAYQASISAIQVQPVTLTETNNNATSTTLDFVEFTFNIEGNYGTLVKVLEALQTSSRLFSIENLNLNRATETGAIVMSVNGKAYYLK